MRFIIHCNCFFLLFVKNQGIASCIVKCALVHKLGKIVKIINLSLYLEVFE